MPIYDGQLLTIDLVITIMNIPIKVKGTVEVLGIRRKMES